MQFLAEWRRCGDLLPGLRLDLGLLGSMRTPAMGFSYSVIGEVAFPLFDLKARQQPLRGLRRALRRVGDRLAGRQRDSGQRYD